jgi:hypothetical protein
MKTFQEINLIVLSKLYAEVRIAGDSFHTPSIFSMVVALNPPSSGDITRISFFYLNLPLTR